MSVEELETGLRRLFAQTYNEYKFNKSKRNYIEVVKARF